MKAFLRLLKTAALVTLAAPHAARGQVLLTGENGGRGANSLMVSANAILPDESPVLANFWIQYGRGATSWLDLSVSYGNITTLDSTQHYVSAGSSVGLLKRKRFGLDLALYNNAAVPFTRTNQACSVLLTSALLASRPLRLGGLAITPYGGWSRLAPLGHREDAIFTPPEVVHSLVAGAAVPLSRSLTLFVEYNVARAQQGAGTGALHVLNP